MSEQLTLERAKDLKANCEEEINRIIKSFEERTKLSVSDITLSDPSSGIRQHILITTSF